MLACEHERAYRSPVGASAGMPAPFLAFERAMDAAVETGSVSVQAVEDVAFLVQLELRQRAERLSRLGAGADAAAVIGECDSALRRIRKGLGAIDAAIARASGEGTLLDFSSELQGSLLVRRAYSKFRARLLEGGVPGVGELQQRMRAAGTHIAMLVGWPAYPLFRIRDRLQLRELQQRILAWLRGGPNAGEVEGLRLWRDLVSFVEMLAQISRRQELVEHDSKLVGDLLARLRAVDLSTAGFVDESMDRLVRPLEGLDEELDGFLCSDLPLPAERLYAILDRLRRRLGAAPEGTT